MAFTKGGAGTGGGGSQDPFTIVNTSVDYTMLPGDDLIFVDSTAIITILDPSTVTDPVSICCLSGTTTITPAAGTTDVSVLTPGLSVTLAPRNATEWRTF